MNYQFADRVSGLQPSAIREILKFTSMPGMISLAAGNPAPKAFPAKEVAEISEKLLREDPIAALQYSITEGYAPLRETLRDYYKKKYNIGRDFDDLIITSGAQQVAELTAKALCNEGDTVICENPSFVGILNAFRSFGLKLCGIPMQSDGMDINALEQALKTNKNVKLIYTIPNFQNPTGITMSEQKRHALYDLAKKYKVMILEDNPYGAIRFSGKAIPSIKSFDEDGIVVYGGSFSKVLSPGMRVGCCIAPKEVLAKIIVCKQVSDVHTNIWSQIIAHRFMTEYDFEAHLERIRAIYRHKAGITTEQLNENLSPAVTYNPIQGGLFFWCTLPRSVNMMDFCTAAVKKKVAVVPGIAFLTDENAPCNSFRINFSTPTDEQLTEGLGILGNVLDTFIDR